MLKLKYVPTYDQLNDVYGNPESEPGILDTLWADTVLIRIRLPFTMRLSWRPDYHTDYLQIHKKVADVLVDAFEEIKGYRGETYLYNRGYNFTGGSFNFRVMRNGKKLSTHSWGIAVDINPHIAPYNRKNEDGEWVNNQPDFIVKAMISRGLYSFEFDGMHFQAVRSFSKYAIFDHTLNGEDNGNRK